MPTCHDLAAPSYLNYRRKSYQELQEFQQWQRENWQQQQTECQQQLCEAQERQQERLQNNSKRVKVARASCGAKQTFGYMAFHEPRLLDYEGNKMFCEVCSTWHGKQLWSPGQWRHCSPYLPHVPRNCCNNCDVNNFRPDLLIWQARHQEQEPRQKAAVTESSAAADIIARMAAQELAATAAAREKAVAVLAPSCAPSAIPKVHHEYRAPGARREDQAGYQALQPRSTTGSSSSRRPSKTPVTITWSKGFNDVGQVIPLWMKMSWYENDQLQHHWQASTEQPSEVKAPSQMQTKRKTSHRF